MLFDTPDGVAGDRGPFQGHIVIGMCFWGFLCVDSTKKAISLPGSVLTGLSLSALSFMRNTMLLRKSEVPCVLEAPFIFCNSEKHDKLPHAH